MWKSLPTSSSRGLYRRFFVPTLSVGRRSGCTMTDASAAPPPAKKQCTEERENGANADSALAESLAAEPSLAEALAENTEPCKDENVPFQRIKRKKCALLMSYNGKGYLGMQINPGTKTIEGELLNALAKAKAYPEDMEDDVGKLQFQRCSRTDKGVSAVRQVVSLKMSPEPSVAELANQFLPPQIRIMGFRKVTKGFNSKNACTARSYEYLMPTYTFAPYAWTTLDYRIDESTLDKVCQLLKMYEKSHNYHNFTSGKKFEEQSSIRHIFSFTCSSPFVMSVSAPPNHSSLSRLNRMREAAERVEGPNGAIEDEREATTCTDNTENTATASDRLLTEESDLPTEITESDTDRLLTKDGRLLTEKGDAEGLLTKDNRLLTKEDRLLTEERRGTEEGAAKKKLVEFVTLKVKGQSFMMHQIRKMVGLVIAIVRGFTPETTLIESFQREKVDIPRAPALGLLLENVFFDGYNKRYRSDSTHDVLEWVECEGKVEAFKKSHIYSSIVDTEISEMSMMQWLGSLQIHEFFQTRQRIADAVMHSVGREKATDVDTTQEKTAGPI